METSSSANRVKLEAFRSISIHKMVLNFMRNGPFGRASVHLNNGQGISLYVMIRASGNFAEMLKFQCPGRSVDFKILPHVSDVVFIFHPRVRVTQGKTKVIDMKSSNDDKRYSRWAILIKFKSVLYVSHLFVVCHQT